MNRLINRMLKENTGVALLDSGGAYGRNWEHNQKRKFSREPACKVELNTLDDKVEVILSFNTYHYLNAYLERDQEAINIERRFFRFAELPSNKDKGWPEIMETFAGCRATNTYNYDNLISQTLQYVLFNPAGLLDDSESCYILLQIHGGCDVRGGYTKPRVFRVSDWQYFVMAQTECDAFAENGMTWWSDDCGYHWYKSDDKQPALTDVLIEKDGKPYIKVTEYEPETRPTLFDVNQYGLNAFEREYPVTFAVRDCY